MKGILLAAASVAVFASASASAQSTTVTINGDVAKKCGISAQSSTVTLPNDLTDSNAKVRSAVTDEIATALNGARVIAFCNTPSSSVEVTRNVLRRQGSTGNGLVQDFAQVISYALDVSINNMFLDSTNDGASVVASRFGGHDSLSATSTHLKFAKASNGAPVPAVNGPTDVSNQWVAATDRRLAAGTYTGSVSVTLTPGA